MSGTCRLKPLWMAQKAVKVIRKERKVYQKYKDATHPAYCQAQKKAKVQLKKAKEFGKKLAKNIKEDRKSFFAYARSKSKTKANVGSLEDSQGSLHSESTAKAELLNDFFSTVFTREIDTYIPVLKPMCETIRHRCTSGDY